MEGPLIILICAITFLVFVLSVSIVGVLMYRLGINGRITRMMEDADNAKGEAKTEKEPSVVPGAEFDPTLYGYEPRRHWSYDQDDLKDSDEEEFDDRFVTDEEIEQAEIEDEPIVAGKKHKVVMTGGSIYGGNSSS